MVRPLYALPTGHRWDRTAGVTLLGDAAHLAAPNGEGANLAMLDGAELGRALAAHPEDVERALATYEEAMFARAAETEEEDFMPGIDSPDNTAHRLVALFQQAQEGAQGQR
ncbi:FAD-binding domain-containing protein OS=Streptomyces viridochromogenes OX=1938 GN=ADK34_35405 PE=4 SV=1 [Streptomyces viridochromogenes]